MRTLWAEEVAISDRRTDLVVAIGARSPQTLPNKVLSRPRNAVYLKRPCQGHRPGTDWHIIEYSVGGLMAG